jgi:AcrR family transcriptional regulator
MSRIADPRAKIELLRAAEAVFAEHGLAASKVEHITARAGVSKGAFYLHFESKDDCWRQIIEGFVAKLANCLDFPEEIGTDLTESVTEHLERWHRHDLEILEFSWQNRAILRMVLAGGGGTPYAYLIDEFAARVAETTEGWLRIAMGAGVYRADLDTGVVVALISGGYERLVRALINSPKRPDIAAWSYQALSLFTRGLLTDEARNVLDREVSSGTRSVAPPTESAPSLVTAAVHRDAERGKRRSS